MKNNIHVSSDNDFEEEPEWLVEYWQSKEYCESLEEQARQYARAKVVFDVIAYNLDRPIPFDIPDDYDLIHEQAKDKLNLLIRENLDSESIWEFIYLVGDMTRSTRAKLLARNRHIADPKQRAKEHVRDCWERWKNEPSRYKGKAAFARDMLDKYEELTSQRVIERWCKEWESEPS